jgi:hypothetical protein
MLAAGIKVHERSSLEMARAQLLSYDVEANSPGGEFIDGFSRTGGFSELFSSPSARLILGDPAASIPLRLAGELLQQTAARIVKLLSGSQRSSIHGGNSIDRIEVNTTAGVRLFGPEGYRGESHSVLVATGAQSRRAPVDCDGSVFHVSSDDFLRRRSTAVQYAVESGRTIHVVGSSHSAISCVSALLRLHGEELRPLQVQVHHRKFKLYYRSVAEALAAGCDLTGLAVCPKRGDVCRYDGLRGGARQFYEGLVAGGDDRVELRPLSWAAQPKVLQDDLVISAIGYERRNVQVFVDGREVLVHKVAPVDRDCRLVDYAGCPIPRLFGAGLGWSPLDRDGHSEVGFNLFCGAHGEAIVKGLLSEFGANDEVGRVPGRMPVADW